MKSICKRSINYWEDGELGFEALDNALHNFYCDKPDVEHLTREKWIEIMRPLVACHERNWLSELNKVYDDNFDLTPKEEDNNENN